MAADARHEFVTSNLVHLRSVPVVNENNHPADGATGGRYKGSSKRKKQRCYRALSGVSFQNSVEITPPPSSSRSMMMDNSSLYHNDCWDQSSYCWPSDPMQSSSPAGTVKVTFVHRTITDYSDRVFDVDDYVNDEEEEEDIIAEILDLDDEDYDQSSVSVVELHPADEEHIYDTPCSVEELYSDSDLSGLDLSIFEPGSNDNSPVATTNRPLLAPSGDNIKKQSGRKAFIYRPPRPTTLSRGKTFRERLAKPLQKFFNVPTPPAVDYEASNPINNVDDEDQNNVANVTELDSPSGK